MFAPEVLEPTVDLLARLAGTELSRPMLERLWQLTGFTLEHRYADWAGAEFTADRTHVSIYQLARSQA